MEEDPQNKSNNLNLLNIDNQSSSYGLLDKLQILKEHQASPQIIVKDHSIALIKTSNDPDLARLCSLFVSSSSNTPIGLRLAIRIIPIAEKTVLNLRVYEYNYLLSKKFKYLKAEAINSSMTLLILINIYDKKCFHNLKDIIEELSAKGSNLHLNNNNSNNAKTNYQSSSSVRNNQLNNKNVVVALLKSTNNFLLKITERQNVINAKKEIEDSLSRVKVKIVEMDIDEINDVNHTLVDLIK